ncbi:ATP-binding cassette domain-containing protein [Thiolapillus brandeum]|uniref:Probable ATP-binding protein YheS n=1 Tax=Thiolapillus brandeum TaxID=1076588 RepID=A0A7U6GKU9_9GAMM|nr:ATP-binding cassette domain-containing protein [Thiolapillus brandeum]BAO45469.1 ABC transporter ATP-binding protein [Thiolapillus brandeum]
MLHFQNLSLRRGSKLLFEDANFQIHPGQKVGITGANGTGKSSLFALIRGTLQADSGDLKLPGEWVIAWVAQETPQDSRPAMEYVLDGDQELRQIEAAIEQAQTREDGHQLALLHGQFEQIGGYQARSRAGQLLNGLGFKPGDEQRPVTDFSGGWRMRLNLARALICRSDLLLLDEPTNHLDLDAVIWLENWLKRYPGTLLLISHDREFLDAVTDHIAHIEQGKLTLYSGNYSAFERIRAEQLANQQAEHLKQQREIAHIKSYVDRFRAKATKARQAQSRLKALERMELIAPAHVDSPFHFRFREPEKTPHPLLRLEDAAAGYGDKAIVSGIGMSLSPGDRIGLLGPNGAGKSTFIKLLSGNLPLMYGKLETAQDLKIGYFAQHQVEQLHPEHSPLEHLTQLDPQAREQALRDYLGGFGFPGDKALEKTAPFSGGEKSRLALALLIYQRPNLLLLDEPTNHLDLEMRQALATALQDFTGAMVIVSHDRHLLRVSTDELLLVHDGRVKEFEGSLDDYPGWLAAQRSRDPDATGTRTEPDNSAHKDRKQTKREAAARRQALQPLKNRVASAEKKLDQLHRQQKALETQLADNTLYETANKDKLKQLLADKAEVDARCEEQEMIWLEASEALECAESA